jgi:TIR domain-containing protein
VKYNLTDSQKALARRIVQGINEAWVTESFFVLWNWSRGPGSIVMCQDGKWRIDDIDRGALEALAAEAMVRLVQDKHWPAWPKGIDSMLPTVISMRCDVAQKLFEAVERNFAEEPMFSEGAVVATEAATTGDEPDIFISHSSRDEALASALINVFEAALNPVNIRCSSVAGYRFKVGGDFPEQMRAEVDQSKVFVALLTPASVRSPEVLFEIGARWGTKNKFLPLLAGGAKADLLKGLLRVFQAVECENYDDLKNVVAEAASTLGKTFQATPVFNGAFGQLQKASAARAQVYEPRLQIGEAIWGQGK